MIHISYHIYEIVDSKKKLFLNSFLFARFDSKSYFQFRLIASIISSDLDLTM